MTTKIISKLGLYIAMLALFILPLAVPAFAHAATEFQDKLCSGTDLSLSGTGDCSSSAGASTDVNSIITQAVNIFSGIVGIVAVIMIVYGGFRYITSGGDSAKVTAAKNTIVYAIIGLIVVALAQFIVRFVLEKVVS